MAQHRELWEVEYKIRKNGFWLSPDVTLLIVGNSLPHSAERKAKRFLRKQRLQFRIEKIANAGTIDVF